METLPFSDRSSGLPSRPERDDIFAYSGLDQVSTIEVRPPSIPRGIIRRCYEEARNGRDEPIVYTAASLLASRRGATVGIATGATAPSLPRGENDGPLGSIAAAHALAGIGCRVVLLAEEPVLPVMAALAASYPHRFEVIALELNHPEEHAELAGQLDALICVEKAGSNPAGVLHSMTGVSREGTRARIDGLARRMMSLGKLTVGIGDGGNEIGFGNIRERVKALVPYGEVCRCPCGQGILASTETDVLYPVGVSNWGGYALAAALAIAHSDISLAHTADREREFFQLALEHDCRDGQSGRNSPTVDGIRAETSIAVCQILWNIADHEIRGRLE